MLKRLFGFLIGLIFPPACQACRISLPWEDLSGVCAKCESQIKWLAPPHCARCGRTLKRSKHSSCETCAASKDPLYFDRVFACAAYQGTTREILHRYKFGPREALGHFLSEHMRNFADHYLKKEDFDAVMCVPLDPKRHSSRGFNQSLRLSQKLSKAMKLEEISSVVARKSSPSCQSSLSKIERKANVRDCFFVKNPKALARFKRVLLVDDILTSGQTLSECSRTLKNGGVRSVTALAFARGI